MARMLGKKPYVADPRSLRLSKYLMLPTVPALYNWGSDISTWPMFLNDSIGDCTCACVGHAIEDWTAANGSEATITDNDVLQAYEAVSGYDPTTGANDNGAEIKDVLKYWQQTGIAGHQVGAFAEVDITNLSELMAGIYLFGGLDAGVQLPIAAQNMGQTWAMPTNKPPKKKKFNFWSWLFGWSSDGAKSVDDVAQLTGDWAPGSWGGHCVWIVAYNAQGVTVVSWGELIEVTWEFFKNYFDEAWACISPDWFTATPGVDPTGLNVPELTQDLAQVQQ